MRRTAVYWLGNILLLGQNPVFHAGPRGYGLAWGGALLILGLLWLPVSVHPQADRGWLQAVTALPVLLALVFIRSHYKKKGTC